MRLGKCVGLSATGGACTQRGAGKPPRQESAVRVSDYFAEDASWRQGSVNELKDGSDALAHSSECVDLSTFDKNATSVL
jgi:hypothetical protein